ncbi:tissue factor-like isoform X3 [Phycodurus eques]|uniref:tissue factor-like isoform X3 n=1 Tax=Phycodurus eques TaxID=693459 RepID=UPI002ACE6417|nr:tissue factor-like isoform X3 [Phycodurus eques]
MCCNMASLKQILYLGVCMSAWMITAADEHAPKAENVRWVSLDFKTLLTWTPTPSNYTFTVQYSWDDSDWMKSPNCIQISETECDLSKELEPLHRTFIADIQTEPVDNTDFELDEFPHTYSPPFTPYGQSEISAAEFTVEVAEEGRASVTIEDPLTSFHKYGKQLTIRDILKNDLQYKISYYKSGNTGKIQTVPARSLEHPAVYSWTEECLARAESWSFGWWTFYPGNSPHCHHHSDSSMLQTKKQNLPNVSVIYSYLIVLATCARVIACMHTSTRMALGLF